MSRWIAWLMVAAIAAPAHAAGRGETDKILKIIGDARGASAPGCAVGLFRDGKTLFATSGSMDLDHPRPADADTLFYTASVAKQFTALATAQLVAQGKIRLDQDIRTLLPEMPKMARPMTVEMLMHHTSGVQNNLNLMDLDGYADRWEAAPRAEVLAQIFQYPDTTTPPGTTYLYSNGGYFLLSEIVKRVSGQDFPDYVEQHVLRPMGMQRSLILRDVRPTGPNIARGYLPKGEGFELSEGYALFGGSGGMMTTINDLARYQHDFAVSHKVWTPAVTKIMLDPAIYADGSPVLVGRSGAGYGGGLNLGHDWVLHEGGAVGFKTLVALLPGRDVGLAMLCNRGDYRPTELGADIIQAVAPALPPVRAPRFEVPTIGGRYVSDEVSAVYDLTLAGDDLTVAILSAGGQPRSTLHLTRRPDRSFANETLSLVFDDDNRGFRARVRETPARFHRAPAR